jgi:hypothetical protein
MVESLCFLKITYEFPLKINLRSKFLIRFQSAKSAKISVLFSFSYFTATVSESTKQTINHILE